MAEDINYPNYQSLRSRWVTRVPEHWSLLRAKNFLREVDDRSKTGEGTLLSMRMQRGLVPHNDVSVKRIAPEDLIGYKKAQPDELVLNRMQAGNAMFFRNCQPGLVSPDYAVFRLLRDDNPEYLGHLFRSWPMRGLFRSESKGLGTGTSGFLRLYSDRFAALEIPLPPRPEQDQIVSYLRVQDMHISRFIKAKRELINLLQEQKKNLIQRALTNGIAKGVSTKPSGVEWIGEVPAHWEIRKLKQIGRFGSGAGFPIDYQGRTSLDIPFFKVSDMTSAGNDVHMLTTRNSISREQASALGAKIFPAGATIFPKVGGALLTNKRRLLVRNSCIDNNVMAFVPFSGNSEYWYWILTLLDFGRLANPGPVPALNASTIKDLLIPCPSEEEQNNIVEYIRALCLELDAGILLEKQGIELIREYRDRLIADVVTGQVDVRGWQPSPEDVVDDAALTALGDDTDDVTEEEDGDGED